MPDLALRPAREEDFPSIRSLIRHARINPTGLDWRRFVVVTNATGVVIGCAQLKPHRGGLLELASVAVGPAYQGRGIARVLIEHLISKAPRPLYLTCRSSLAEFYQKWGFRSLELAEMPPYYQRLVRVSSLLISAFQGNERLQVMMLQ